MMIIIIIIIIGYKKKEEERIEGKVGSENGRRKGSCDNEREIEKRRGYKDQNLN